jgi:hypothetical protein
MNSCTMYTKVKLHDWRRFILFRETFLVVVRFIRADAQPDNRPFHLIEEHLMIKYTTATRSWNAVYKH